MSTVNKTVVITGAGKGIGFELTKVFLNKETYNVWAISRNVDQLRTLNSSRLKIIQGDLRSNYSHVLGEIRSAGPVNFLINNAAEILNEKLVNISDDQLYKVMETNFHVPFKLIRDLSENFERGTHIVNISSMSGFQGSKKFDGLSVYSASKAALASLSECVAQEFLDRGVFCNCLALGAVDTGMIKVSIPGMAPEITSVDIASYIYGFTTTGHKYCNGRILPITTLTH